MVKTAFATCKNSVCEIQSTAVNFRPFVHSPIINRRENAQTDKNKHKYVLCPLDILLNRFVGIKAIDWALKIEFVLHFCMRNEK